MFCPKSSPSHLYSWAKGGGTPSFHRIFYFGEPPQFQLFLEWANQIGSLQKKKEKRKKEVEVVRHPQLINMKQNKYPRNTLEEGSSWDR
jgi:hypothetical protein